MIGVSANTPWSVQYVFRMKHCHVHSFQYIVSLELIGK